MMDEQKLLFENLKKIKDYWVKTAIKKLDVNADLSIYDIEQEYKILQSLIQTDEQKQAYEKVLNELIEGTVQSILMMIDGDDELASKLKVDLIVSQTNKSLTNNNHLHEEFIEYLLDVEE